MILPQATMLGICLLILAQKQIYVLYTAQVRCTVLHSLYMIIIVFPDNDLMHLSSLLSCNLLNAKRPVKHSQGKVFPGLPTKIPNPPFK